MEFRRVLFRSYCLATSRTATRDIAHDHLGIGPVEGPGRLAVGVRYPVVDIAVIDNPQVESVGPLQEVLDLRVLAHNAPAGHDVQTGRASCREKGCRDRAVSGVAVTFNNK